MALLIFVSGILVVVLVVWRELFRFAAVEDRAYRACVLHVWRAQDEQRKLLTKLLRLNPAADRLRVQRRQAELKLRAALATGNPKVIAAAKAHLAVIVAKQTALHTKQQTLLLESRVRAKRFNTQLATELKRVRREGPYAVSRPLVDPIRLAVRPVPPQELAPRYVPEEPFLEAQRAGASWKIGNLNAQCHATLEQRNGEWRVRLVADKS